MGFQVWSLGSPPFHPLSTKDLRHFAAENPERELGLGVQPLGAVGFFVLNGVFWVSLGEQV